MGLPSFTSFEFAHDGLNHTVYRKGDKKSPAIVIIQELPGITPETVAFADRLVTRGFQVYLPHLWGTLNRASEPVKNLLRVCISRELNAIATDKPSRLSQWLIHLCRAVKTDADLPGVGLIGMCFSGGFVLSVMIDDSVIAPVIAQPGHVRGMWGKLNRPSLGAPARDIELARQRSERDDVHVMGFRFSRDPMCPGARFDALQAVFGERFHRFEIDSSLFNPHWIPPTAHSVFTLNYVDRHDHPTRHALDALVDFFRTQFANAQQKKVPEQAGMD